MNEHYNAFVDLGKRLADERGVKWDVRLNSDGIAVQEDAWNITLLVGDSPPPIHWIRDFGLEGKILDALNQRRTSNGLSPLEKVPMSAGWQAFYKAAIVEQLFFRKNSTGHVISHIARPIRAIATAAVGREPWELHAEDISLANELAKETQPSGKLADVILGITKTLIDANHIAEVGPLSPSLAIQRHTIRAKRARFTKSVDELRSDLENRKHEEKLPERRAFWELVRIVFTEQPKTFLDQLRFAQSKVMLLCGLRVGEAALLPADWKRVREYFDPAGRPAGELGGHSSALMLRHFAEKQQTANSDSVELVESAQYVPAMFEEILTGALDTVVSLTEPLRKTLRRQIEERRILPWFQQDQLIPVVELYPYLTGNPVLLASANEDLLGWQARYRTQFAPALFDEIHEQQLRQVNSTLDSLNSAVYVFFHRMKDKITLRNRNGIPWRSERMRWLDVYLRIDELEAYLTTLPTKLSDSTPLRLSPGGEIATWELMFLMPKRALAEGRNDGLCDITRYYSVGRFDPSMMQLALGNKDGVSGPTLFESYGATDEDRALTLNTHSLRHLQNTELFRLGVADTIIAKRFNRRSVAQSYEYDHRSLAEELEHIELPVDVEISLGSKASTVARMIAAGSARGPIVDSFKKIQQSQGDDAAFEFLKVEADGFHSTPYGHCINSFTVDPCPKHLECFAGCRHLTATDMPQYRRHLVQLEGRFRDALAAIEARPARTIGRENQLAHARERLAAVHQILITPEGQSVFPDGDDLSEKLPGRRSVLGDC
ncbi:MAG: hypothetical protein HZC22_07220 [Rhodocyclales bacterium]|nr:hypothetical protein [Rhodocyclales bacterium]